MRYNHSQLLKSIDNIGVRHYCPDFVQLLLKMQDQTMISVGRYLKALILDDP